MTHSSDDPAPFWRTTVLENMSREQWESLCDGCGQCCRFKLEDRATGEVVSTEVACRLLDTETCRCTDYANRQTEVPGCQVLTPDRIGSLDWLPETCGYRLVAAGKDLFAWHPLKSGDPESVHRAGISVRGRVYSEREIGDVQAVLAQWYDLEIVETPDAPTGEEA